MLQRFSSCEKISHISKLESPDEYQNYFNNTCHDETKISQNSVPGVTKRNDIDENLKQHEPFIAVD